MQTREIQIGSSIMGGGRPLVLISGPCVLEDEATTLRIAEALKKLTDELGIGYIFKASYDKANRSSVGSYRGPGMDEGLRLLEKVKTSFGVPVLSDVHEVCQIAPAAEVLDVLQIPAFLCRQTDLLLAAGASGKVVNVKKGQFMAPWDMENVVNKVASTGNQQICLTERGASFGYNNLVVDMRSLAIMRNTGYPVIFDATHAVQLPGGAGTESSGQREFVDILSRAAVAVGIDGLFWEVHENPDKARCDGANSLALSQLRDILTDVLAIDAIRKKTHDK